jgi:hypothetical protein
MPEHHTRAAVPAHHLNNDRKMFLMILVVALLVTLVLVLWPKFAASQQIPPRTAFAECLTAKGVTMYGEDTCPNCQLQKGMFEDDFKFIHYVDCVVDQNTCAQQNIQGYPTWIGQGKTVMGIQTFIQLGQLGGCAAPS